MTLRHSVPKVRGKNNNKRMCYTWFPNELHVGGIIMKKIYYYFGECGRMAKILLTIGIVSAVVALAFLFKGGFSSLIRDDEYFTLYNAWFLFFLAISIFAFIADLCIHKICADIATLLKENEENKKIKQN